MMRLEFENGSSQNIVDVDLRLLIRRCLLEAFLNKSDESIEEGLAFSPHECILLLGIVPLKHVQEEHYRFLPQGIDNFLTDAFDSRCKISSNLDVLVGEKSSDYELFNIPYRKHLLYLRSVEGVKIVDQLAVLNKNCNP
jgi:hypothetical protein